MTYASGGLIQATDYGTSETTGFVGCVNAIWGVGSGDSGYGQSTTLTGVAAGNTVTATQWATLLSRLDSMSRHQTNSLTGLTSPVAGDIITYLSTLSSTISTLTTNRLTATAFGTTANTTISNTTGWVTTSTKEISLTWANANAMRYFFNAGGYIDFTLASSVLSGNTKSTDWDALLAACGTARVTAQTSGKIGGSGSPTVNNTNLGFYDLTTNYQTIIQQFSTTATGGYNTNNAVFKARLDAAAGSATILYIDVDLTDASADDPLPVGFDTVSGNVILTVSVVPPSSVFLSNVWGSVTPATITNTQS
jgi:hypothetical protein